MPNSTSHKQTQSSTFVQENRPTLNINRVKMLAGLSQSSVIADMNERMWGLGTDKSLIETSREVQESHYYKKLLKIFNTNGVFIADMYHDCLTGTNIGTLAACASEIIGYVNAIQILAPGLKHVQNHSYQKMVDSWNNQLLLAENISDNIVIKHAKPDSVQEVLGEYLQEKIDLARIAIA